MNVTLTLDDELVKRVRKIAVDRDTTMTAMVRDYLEGLASESEDAQIRAARELLARSFKKHEFRIGPRTWSRADLHERRS